MKTKKHGAVMFLNETHELPRISKSMLKQPLYRQHAMVMLGVKSWNKVPLLIRLRLAECAKLVSNAGGELRSRQAIAAIILFGGMPKHQKCAIPFHD